MNRHVNLIYGVLFYNLRVVDFGHKGLLPSITVSSVSNCTYVPIHEHTTDTLTLPMITTSYVEEVSLLSPKVVLL